MVYRLIYLALWATMISAQASEHNNVRPASAAARVEGYSVDLIQLYRESRLEDPRVIAAYSKAKSGDEQKNQAFGSLLPSVAANANFNRIKQISSQVDEAYHSRSYSVGLSQPLYNKAAWENYQQYRSLAEQANFEAQGALAEATVDLAQRYFAALAADDELELIQAERRATQSNLDRVSALYKKQLAVINDLLDLKARVDLLAAREVDARNQVSLSRVSLSEIVGRSVTERLRRVRDDVDLKVSLEGLANWVDLAVAENPAIKASENGQSAAEAALRAAKGGHYPVVSLNVTAQQTNEGFNNSLAPRTDSYVAGIGVQIPIYSGGTTSARVRQLYQDQVTAEQQLIATRRQVVKETTNAYLTADSSIEKIRANRNAIVSAEQSRIAAEKAFRYGLLNSVDVLTAVQNEFQARRDLLAAQYDFITNLFVLNRWAGRLPEETVDHVNIWLGDSRLDSALTAPGL
ncbi:outer membrane protein [Pseudomonas sp. CC120222-01a]|nr:outer membrane protein [Pseudomonas sp. CC120222-01a]